MKKKTYNNKKQSGATFVEVLIAVLIFAFGALGAASLQITSKKAAYDAQQMLTATFLTNAIIERMRNNPEALDTYASTNVGSGSVSSEPTPNCTEAAPCNATQLATHDLWVWEQAIDGASMKSGTTQVGGLVKPTGCINHDEGRVQIVISWHGMDELSDAGTLPSGVSSCGSASSQRRQIVVNTFIQ